MGSTNGRQAGDAAMSAGTVGGGETNRVGRRGRHRGGPPPLPQDRRTSAAGGNCPAGKRVEAAAVEPRTSEGGPAANADDGASCSSYVLGRSPILFFFLTRVVFSPTLNDTRSDTFTSHAIPAGDQRPSRHRHHLPRPSPSLPFQTRPCLPTRRGAPKVPTRANQARAKQALPGSTSSHSSFPPSQRSHRRPRSDTEGAAPSGVNY